MERDSLVRMLKAFNGLMVVVIILLGCSVMVGVRTAVLSTPTAEAGHSQHAAVCMTFDGQEFSGQTCSRISRILDCEARIICYAVPETGLDCMPFADTMLPYVAICRETAEVQEQR
jgi:hypothetical protein